MNKFGLLSAVAAAGVILSGAAFAEEHAKTAVKSEVAATAPTSAELKDGTKVKIDGEKVFVIGTDGKETAAPDGTHELKDGKKLTTKGGLVVKQ